MIRLLLLVGAVCLSAGCTSLSGLDAKTSLDCKAPKGLGCVSISEAYQVSGAGKLPSRKATTDRGPDNPDALAPGGPIRHAALPAASSGARSPSVQFTTPSPIPTAAAAVPGAAARTSPAELNAPSSGTPLRTPERVLRIWVAPFQDVEGDLHDQRYMYVAINPGQWTIESARASIRNQYQVVRPLSRPEAAAPTPTSTAEVASRPALPPGTQLPLPAGVVPAPRSEDR